MPLPIETPAPKASSLIKRFQQTIDSLDANQSLPLPDSSHKQPLYQISQARRSTSAGTSSPFHSPQLGAPNRSSWNPPRDFDPPTALSRLQTTDTLTLSDGKTPAVLSDHSTRPTPHNSLTPADLKGRSTRPPHRNTVLSDLDLPAAPPIDQPPNISRLSDLCKSDIAVQSPVPDSKTIHHPHSSDQPKPKASISADVPQAPRSRKVTNHITAPTAASLAKMRDAQVSRSNSQTKASSTKAGPLKAPLRSHATGHLEKNGGDSIVPRVIGSPKLAASNDMVTGVAIIRQTQTSSSAPKERAKMQQVRPSTPATSHALKRSVIAKTIVPPLPSAFDKTLLPHMPSAPVKVTTRRVVTAESQKSIKPLNSQSQPLGHTTASKKSESRPLQRARVASAATPISGIRKSTSLKSTGQASDRLVATTKPAPKISNKSPDLNTACMQNHPVTPTLRSGKSSQEAAIPFPDASSNPRNDKITTTSQEGHATKKGMASQDPDANHIEAKAVGESKLETHSDKVEKENVLAESEEKTDDQDRVFKSEKNRKNEDHQVENQEALEQSEASDESGQVEEIAPIDAHCFDGEENKIQDQKRVVGLIGSIIVDPIRASVQEEEITVPISDKDGQSFKKHATHISLCGFSLNSDDDQSKADFDASTTTNTDVDVEE